MINSLHIEDFRNIENSSFTPVNGVNLFYGKNGAGKTNVLEAIGLFSIGKSCRGAKDIELVNFDSALAEVRAELSVEKKKSISL
jgi:DNA replication and repair protein RecF